MSSMIRPGSSGGPPASGSSRSANSRTQPIASSRTAAFVPIGYPIGRGHSPVSRKPVAEMAFADRWDSPLFDAV